MKIIVCASKQWFNLSTEFSSEHQVLTIRKQEDLSIELLDSYKPDYIFFVHWNWKVKKEIHLKYECIVFHTAPLPFGRGGSPVQNLILQGFNVSPVCAIRMTDDLDAGPIYAKKLISLEGRLSQILLRINDTINDLIINIILDPRPPTEQVGEIHVFNRLGDMDNELPANIDLSQIYDRIRMLDDKSYPDAFLKNGDTKFSFSDAKYEDDAITVSCRNTKC